MENITTFFRVRPSNANKCIIIRYAIINTKKNVSARLRPHYQFYRTAIFVFIAIR